jgi:hypothetical protein
MTKKPFTIFLNDKILENSTYTTYTREQLIEWINEYWTSPKTYDSHYLRIKMELWKDSFISMIPLGLPVSEIVKKCDFIIAQFDETFNTPPKK